MLTMCTIRTPVVTFFQSSSWMSSYGASITPRSWVTCEHTWAGFNVVPEQPWISPLPPPEQMSSRNASRAPWTAHHTSPVLNYQEESQEKANSRAVPIELSTGLTASQLSITECEWQSRQLHIPRHWTRRWMHHILSWWTREFGCQKQRSHQQRNLHLTTKRLLDATIPKHRRLETAETINVVVQVAQGLLYTWMKPLTHCWKMQEANINDGTIHIKHAKFGG